MIADAILFFNEQNMLEFRLKLLWDKVDKFIIVEADHTFSGKKKPWNFDAKRFMWAADKIIYYQYKAVNVWDGENPPVQTDPSHPCWNTEYEQRAAILDATAFLSDDDILLMGDCDEIPSPDIFSRMDNIIRWEPVALRQAFFYYNLSCLRREQWNGTIICKMSTARRHGTQGLRMQRNIVQSMPGGWHLSYFNTVGGIQQKLNSFSHVEYNTPEYNSQDHIKECIEQRRDLFVRGMIADKVDRAFFPEYFLTLSDNYNWW